LPNPPAFDAPAQFGTKKLDWCGYPMVKKLEVIFIVLTDTQTDTA